MSTLKQSPIAYIRKEHDSKHDRKPLDYGMFVRIFSYTRPYAFKRNILLGLVVSRSIQLPILLWGIGAIINGPIAGHDVRGMLWAVAAFLGFTLFTQFTFHYRQRLALELGELVIHDVRRDLFKHMMNMPMGFFTRTRLGRLISLFTSDAEAVRNGIQSVVFVTMVQAGNMIIAAILMFWYDWKMFLVVLAMAPIIWGLNRYFRQRLINAYREVQESFSRVTATVVESIKGMKIIQGYARQDLNSEMFRDLVYDHSTYNLRVTQAEATFLPLLEVNSQFFLSALLIYGGSRVLGHDMTLASFIQFFFLSGMFFSPIQTLAGQYNQALTAMAGAERLFKFLDSKPDWQDPETVTNLDKIDGKVEFKDVTFAYKPDRNVLANINFTAEPGQTIALVGSTGSGKTTITNLITKFYLPGEGKVMIDGKDIIDIETKSLRRHLGIVLQVNFLFTGTVMENILVGRPGATEQDAMDAARKIDCFDLIEALPDGFQTVVGEGGAGLSLGQRQIICFSRAMLANPRIFILDEATSSVDAITEERLQNALAKLLAGRTSFVVAHRLSTIRNADMVLVLEAGKIVERGNHRQLLKINGVYARLYREFMVAHEL
ncbi:MAG TPA: ABC transporter ATP-binding protein [Lentisphaeria bacterium]|nr:MAG: sugar ABC transporter [Lentisphaerae bacterium GWF2_50_93]HCE44882.1 ABC transporter ATP-binding protein [Lentisphaeria bacterium]